MRNKPVLCYIGLGSNLENPKSQLLSARAELSAYSDIVESGFSSLYQSPPMGPKNQPDFVNAVMAVGTELSSEQLLDRLQKLEREHGRVRRERWGARTLDLDLLLYGDFRIDLPGRLHVPHPGIAERAFVLFPLHELAPDLVIPGLGAVSALIQACPSAGLTRLD